MCRFVPMFYNAVWICCYVVMLLFKSQSNQIISFFFCLGTRRTTLMLFVITLIYIFSFLPHLLLMIFKTLNIDWLSQYGDTGVMLHNLLIRSYFINSASNPIIYSFFSKNFFSECKYILKKTCRQRTWLQSINHQARP